MPKGRVRFYLSKTHSLHLSVLDYVANTVYHTSPQPARANNVEDGRTNGKTTGNVVFITNPAAVYNTLVRKRDDACFTDHHKLSVEILRS